MVVILTKSIYHCHTDFCNHAKCGAEAAVIKAINEGFTTIGFSEHVPWPNDSPLRMSFERFLAYIEHIHEIKRKYKGKINVYCGIEMEYDTKNHDFFTLLRNTKGIDYAVFGNHYSDETNGKKYIGNPNFAGKEEIIKFVNQFEIALKTNLFLYVAHPDVFLNGYQKWDDFAIEQSKKIIDICLKYKKAMAFNLNGFFNKVNETPTRDGLKNMCPHYPFWELALKMGANVHIEVDAHDLTVISKELMKKAEHVLLKEIGFKNIVTSFEINK